MKAVTMMQWGAGCFLFGLLSFVLPMFGRQFLILNAMGGGAGLGLILMLGGGGLFFAGRQKAQDELDAIRKHGLDGQRLHN